MDDIKNVSILKNNNYLSKIVACFKHTTITREHEPQVLYHSENLITSYQATVLMKLISFVPVERYESLSCHFENDCTNSYQNVGFNVFVTL